MSHFWVKKTNCDGAFVEKVAWDIGVAKFGQGGITFVTNLTNNFIFRQTQQKNGLRREGSQRIKTFDGCEREGCVDKVTEESPSKRSFLSPSGDLGIGLV